MSSAANTAKWAGMLLLHLPLYLATSYVMGSLVGDGYHLLIKGGGNLTPDLLRRHFLFASLIDGFLAGVLGFATIRVMFLLPIRVPDLSGPAWKRPQAWTWTISSCWFVFGIWAMAGAQTSVLAAPSGQRFFDVIALFFGRGCNPDLDSWAFRGCTTQLSYTHPWLGTIGYSAAAFIPAGWFDRLRNSSEDSEASNEAQQSEPGEVLN